MTSPTISQHGGDVKVPAQPREPWPAAVNYDAVEAEWKAEEQAVRIGTNKFETYSEAKIARIEFPRCAACDGGFKLQAIGGDWWAVCMKNRTHRGMRTETQGFAPRGSGSPETAGRTSHEEREEQASAYDRTVTDFEEQEGTDWYRVKLSCGHWQCWVLADGKVRGAGFVGCMDTCDQCWAEDNPK